MKEEIRHSYTKTPGDKARGKFMQPGEIFRTNAPKSGYEVGRTSIDGQTNQKDLSLEDYLQTLRDSGQYESVRAVDGAAFDMLGRPVEESVAVFVVKKENQ